MQEVITEIVILMEELSKEVKTGDTVRDLYSVHMNLSRAVGERMRELQEDQKSAKVGELIPPLNL